VVNLLDEALGADLRRARPPGTHNYDLASSTPVGSGRAVDLRQLGIALWDSVR